MKRKTLLPLLMVALSGCQASERGISLRDVEGTLPYGKWGFAFFTPYALPAYVTRAFILDTEGAGESFRTLDSSPGDPDTVQTWNNRVRMHGNFNKAVSLPVGIVFCWDSVIDKKTYETRIIFPVSLRESMMKPTGKDWRGDTTWNDTLLFGLAPGGKVKIWMQNSGGGENMPVTPNRISTFSGNKLDACKDVPSRIDFNYSIPDGYDQDIKDFIKGKTYPYGDW